MKNELSIEHRPKSCLLKAKSQKLRAEKEQSAESRELRAKSVEQRDSESLENVAGCLLLVENWQLLNGYIVKLLLQNLLKAKG